MVPVSGFTIVRNAIELDFPVVESIRSILPWCDEVIVNVGRSTDDTLGLVRSIADPKIKIIETEWDFARGESVLREQTAIAMRSCRHSWGLYIQADEVLHELGGAAFHAALRAIDVDPQVEGIAFRYRHIFGHPSIEAVNRRWYRREVRAVRLAPERGIHPFRDAQGFRVGPTDRPIRARLIDAEMFHYGYVRSAAALRGRGGVDRTLYPDRASHEGDRAYLWWFPGLRPFRGTHPAPAVDWLASRADDPERQISPPTFKFEHLRFYASDLIERVTGWRPFEFRNYRPI